MPWRNLIFSDNWRIRLFRHGGFWLSWWIYYCISRFFYSEKLLSAQKGAITKIQYDNSRNLVRNYDEYWDHPQIWNNTEFIRSFLVVSIHIAAAYFLIYVLLPKFILKGKVLKFVSLFLFLFAGMAVLTRTMDTFVLSALTHQDTAANIPIYSSIFAGVVAPLKVLAAATAIKLGKFWWERRLENEKMEKEKLMTELQLLKAQIRPGFLFNALNNIYVYAHESSPKAPELLIKLSDLLSYMLYECDESLVPVRKEINMVSDYLELERIRLGERMDMELNVIGEIADHQIAPFLLLPFIENGIPLGSQSTESSWLNMDLSMENDTLIMKLSHGLDSKEAGLSDKIDSGLLGVRKRLDILYPGAYDIKITSDHDSAVVRLRIQLSRIKLSKNLEEEDLKDALIII